MMSGVWGNYPAHKVAHCIYWIINNNIGQNVQQTKSAWNSPYTPQVFFICVWHLVDSVLIIFAIASNSPEL